MKYFLGIDIGGTNTDVVLLNQQKQCIASTKVTMTLPLEEGVVEGMRQVMKGISSNDVCKASIGTTHALNALLNVEGLLPVGLIRIAGHFPKMRPGARWNEALRCAVIKKDVTINGGFECHGGAITLFDREEMACAVESLLEGGVKGFSIVSCFGTLFPQQEKEACSLLQKIAGEDIPVTLSHEMGGIGFLERENATLLNTALKNVIGESFSSLERACFLCGLGHAEICLVQNDGSQMTVEEAKKKPLQTIACGPINSARGGGLLSGLDSCIIVDIGGTSTDIARLQNGYVKRSQGVVTVADVRMHFPSPDIVSFALGGGSIVDQYGKIGPGSVARKLCTMSQAFGGPILTVTDLAILLGLVEIEGADPSLIKIDKDKARATIEKAAASIEKAVQIARGEEKDLPCVLVGGGALLFNELLLQKIRSVKLLENKMLTGVANAFGAAHAEISGRFDSIISLHNRDQILLEAEKKARLEAIKKGADPSLLRVVNVSIEPLAYSAERLARVTIAVCGPEKGE